MNPNTVAIKKVVLELINYFFILLFVYAATSKLLDYNTFHTQLGQSPLLAAYADGVVWLVPSIEIIVALLLAFKNTRLYGLVGFYGLMVMFTVYIIIILYFTPFVPCSCGGVLEQLGWTEHLLFNGGVVILSAVLILINAKQANKSNKKMLLHLLLITLLGTATVMALFVGSEKQLKRNNAFIRKYRPHPIEKIGEYQLPSNSFYIAGIDDHDIYLGNYNAPLFIKQLSISDTIETNFRVTIDSTHLPYRRVRISINPPHFYVGDGTVPILFRGHTSNWKATVFSHQDAYFSGFVVADSVQLGLTTISSTTRYKALALLTKNRAVTIEIKENLLAPPLHQGSFDADGMLLWNDQLQKFVYTYFYRNQYLVTDKNLTNHYAGKTIDTLSKPVLDVAHYTKEDFYKLGGQTIIVNRQSTTCGNYLYINSDRLGKYERDEVLKSASIIDVYDLTDQSYTFSFYLYHQPKQKINDIKVYKNVLIALVDNQLWIYRFKPAHPQADL
jgi:hypothetical protein